MRRLKCRASGKSTFARELSESLATSRREIIATTLDGFHFPRIRRHQRGRESAEGYYFDAYDYQSVIEHLLAPLGSSGTREFRTTIFDLHKDSPINIPPKCASQNAILIVDGSFALRNELRSYWDVSIYLKVDPSVAEDRASVRDANSFESSEAARRVTKTRYHGAHSIHNEIAKPAHSATFILSNDDPLSPWLEHCR